MKRQGVYQTFQTINSSPVLTGMGTVIVQLRDGNASENGQDPPKRSISVQKLIDFLDQDRRQYTLSLQTGSLVGEF
mgnify:CR=1 FL=1